jgi:hypothetical protein
MKTALTLCLLAALACDNPPASTPTPAPTPTPARTDVVTADNADTVAADLEKEIDGDVE